MIWSRRTFLQTVLAGTAGAAVASVLPPAVVEVVTTVPLDLTSRYWLYDITAFPTARARRPVHLAIGREDGTTLFLAPLNPRSSFRWVACPGHEFVGPDLVNLSDCDLDIEFMVEQEGRHYHVDRQGQVTEIDTRRNVPEIGDWEIEGDLDGREGV